MAEDPTNTKPDPCSLDEAVWISATEVGEHIAQINHGAWMLAPVEIRDALIGGCDAALEVEQDGQKGYCIPPPGFWLPLDRLRWVNGLNPSMQREDYPNSRWPWELRAYLPPSELWEFRYIEGFARRQRRRRRSVRSRVPLARERVSTLRLFLRRAGAVQWGLWPALESPQAVASEEPPSREQPGESTVGLTGGEAAPAPASVADASVPVANTEAPVAKPEPASPPLVSILEQNAETASSASAAASPAAPQTEPVIADPPLTAPVIADPPQADPVSPDAETGPEESAPPGKQPDELTVVDPTPDQEMRSHDLARPPSDKELNEFVAGFIKNAIDAKKPPTKIGLYQKAQKSLPGATRQRLSDEFERRAKTLPPGRPRKNHQ